MENELYHYGIKGMRWGVRRYQNADGSLTSAGKKRHARDMVENPKRAKRVEVNRWVKEDLERSKRLTDANSNMVNNLKNINNTRIKNQPKTKMDLSNMTDKEMRDRINREILERQYNDMFTPQNTSKGREYASKILDNAGSVLAVTSSALGIALAIKDLKG